VDLRTIPSPSPARARAFLAHCVAISGVRAPDMIAAEALRTFIVARVAGR
jgi:hypothetical protein